jgi:hypothetical protein
MMEQLFSLLPLALIAAVAMVGAIPASAQTPPAGLAATAEPTRVSGPFTHDNLSIYLIHGPSADGPVPLTLSEALAKKLFKVHETGNVQSLSIENLSDEPVFLQAGDIVKGGQQDRVLTMSLVVPPMSGRMPISAYCVEQGRWSARGTESVKTFDSASVSMPSKRAKLAMMAKPVAGDQPSAAPPHAGVTGTMPSQRIGGAIRGDRQQEMWASVAETQARLSANLNAKVAAPASASSLQLALENEKLAEAKAAYITVLSTVAKDADDVIGFAFAANGRINSADVYPSHALFTKMWSKLITAAATEALSEKSAATPPAVPTSDQIVAFLAKTQTATAEEQKLDANTVRFTRQNEAAVTAETRSSTGKVLHRSYVAF